MRTQRVRVNLEAKFEGEAEEVGHNDFESGWERGGKCNPGPQFSAL